MCINCGLFDSFACVWFISFVMLFDHSYYITLMSNTLHIFYAKIVFCPSSNYNFILTLDTCLPITTKPLALVSDL